MEKPIKLKGKNSEKKSKLNKPKVVGQIRGDFWPYMATTVKSLAIDF